MGGILKGKIGKLTSIMTAKQSMPQPLSHVFGPSQVIASAECANLKEFHPLSASIGRLS